VATFYAHFSLHPKGKYVVRVCNGTACHVKGSGKILDALRKHLKLEQGMDTTPDDQFTVETVSCLGACGLAPVMVVNEEVHGLLKPENAIAVIDEIIKRENLEMAAAV
jgi:NADH-quinone oxidoreductase subunit E